MATQVQPHGISRGVTRDRAPRVDARPDLQALAADVRALGAALDRLIDHVEVTENRLVRRVNEMVLSGTLAQRPAAGVADRIYLVVTDHIPGPLYFDDGTQWILVGSPSSEVQRAVLAEGAIGHTFTVAQESATYAHSFSTTWWTMVKVTAQTPTALTVEFSNPATVGDVVTVVLP